VNDFLFGFRRGLRHFWRGVEYRAGVFFNITLRRLYFLRKAPKRIFVFLMHSVILIVSGFERQLMRLPRLIRIAFYAALIAGIAGGLLYGAYALIPTREERRDAFLARGKSLLQEERYPEALIELKNAVQIAPNYAPGHYYLALAYIYLSRLREAAAEFYTCARIDSKNVNALLKLNAVQSLLKDAQDAPGEAPAQPRRGDDYLRGRTLMAKVLLYSGDVRDAYADAKKVYSTSPDTFESNVLMGDISLAQRDFEKAKAHYLKALSLNPQSYEVNFKIGSLYLYDNEFGKAIAQMEAAARLSPNNPMVYKIIGDCYAYQNRYDAAIEQYKKAFAVDKGFVKALKSICNMLVFRGKLVEAAPYVEEFARISPDDPDALLVRAILRFSREEHDGGFADIEKSLKVRKDSLLARFIYGRMLASAGRHAEARDQLLAAVRINSHMTDPRIELCGVYLKLDEGEKALKEAERAVALSPNDIRPRILLGKVYLHLKDYRKAQESFEEIAQKYPDKPDAHYYMGVIHQQKNRRARAVKEYLNALGRDINYLPAFYPLLEIYMATRNYNQAVRLCDKMLRVHPENAGVHEVAGRVLDGFGKKDEALKFYEKAVDLNPKLIAARLRLVDLYLEKNLHMNALQQCEEVLRLSPDNAQTLRKAAQIYQALGNHAKALEFYEKALSLQFDHVSANNAAWLYAQEGGSIERALQLAEQAEIESGYDPRTVDTAAWILIRAGRYDEAVERLRKIVAAQTANPVFKYHLGLALYKKGLFAEAAQVLRESLASGRAYEGSVEAQRLLRELDSKGKE
jgi:tetratricopeptide (TPR) repeat protein